MYIYIYMYLYIYIYIYVCYIQHAKIYVDFWLRSLGGGAPDPTSKCPKAKAGDCRHSGCEGGAVATAGENQDVAIVDLPIVLFKLIDFLVKCLRTCGSIQQLFRMTIQDAQAITGPNTGTAGWEVRG